MSTSDQSFLRPGYRESGGVGLAAAAAAPALAQIEAQAARFGGLQDPTGKYPKPPFQRQSQPWPGLAGKMDPRPDHGETSYEGRAGSPGGRR